MDLRYLEEGEEIKATDLIMLHYDPYAPVSAEEVGTKMTAEKVAMRCYYRDVTDLVGVEINPPAQSEAAGLPTTGGMAKADVPPAVHS